MKRTRVWIVLSWLLVLALLVTSCAKKTEETAPAVKEAAPAVKEAAPAVKEAAPGVKETAPVVKEAVEAPKYGGILVYARFDSIQSWDESYGQLWALSNNLALVNEDLLLGDWAQGPAGSGEFDFMGAGQNTPPRGTVGLLAASWEFPDDQTITYHLRKGIHYALNPDSPASRLVGGRELVADDVVWNFKRQFNDPRTTLYASSSTARPLDIYASDKYTVVVKAPPGTLGMTWEFSGYYVRIMPPEVAKKYGDFQDWKNSVGTGPFILTDYVPMSSVTWVRQPNYYGTDPVGPGKGNQLPYLDSVKCLIVPDTSTRMAALRTGRIDYDCTSYTAEEAQQLRKTSPQLKTIRDVGGFTCLAMRLDKSELPFSPQDAPNALKVRRALNLALNDQEMCDVLYGGEGQTLSFKVVPSKLYEGIYTPLDKLPEESRELFEYHPDKAKQLLAEAGYPNGFKVNIIVNAGSPVNMDLSQMVKAYWAKVGIDLEIRPLDAAVYNKVRVGRSHDQMIIAGRTSFAPHLMYSLKTGDQTNRSMVSDPKLDDYYLKMAALYFDWTKRNPIMKELNLYAIPKAYYGYTPVPYIYYLWQPWLKNFHGAIQVGVFERSANWKFAWIDQELRKSMAGR